MKAVQIEIVPSDGSGTYDVAAHILMSYTERLRGLLGTKADSSAVLIMRCSSIHTYGMTYPIDVAFLDIHGNVLKVLHALTPGKVCTTHGARAVMERPASVQPWPHVDDSVRVPTGHMNSFHMRSRHRRQMRVLYERRWQLW
ncbi:MAG: hypothetical protein ACOX4F_08250 [Atopobiaceae bacterium]|jgi:uncharacterized membrane protein (UPF0127 family)